MTAQEARSLTWKVLKEIERIASEETDGDFKQALDIYWVRFIYG